MTPTQIETTVRRRFNAVGDTFWTTEEFLNLIHLAETELAVSGFLIERTFTASTVASQQDYEFPTNTIALKRVEWDGKKLDPITLNEDDEMTGFDSETSSTGNPSAYYFWNFVVSLRPIPSSVQTLKIRAYTHPSIPVVTSELSIPVFFHAAVIDYIAREMALKDKDYNAYQIMEEKWQQWIQKAKAYKITKKTQDRNPVVRNWVG